ncbi:hypothetical protein [Umezawaea sp. Da 62-37]|uniref:hypothetical protein n=1 Tax=Umezawaea sp. Da 62-37 TaxID=3075927 RepID=UPI0028F72FB1|nr:hypothetical protein [Umezawaea sp. Da 62-37]WNV83585.1 hypothetical protein RM788_36190 [Umezawaea sp. Da 62-37]
MGRARAVLAAVATVVFTVSGAVAASADWTDGAHVGACEFGICGTVVNGLDIPVDIALDWCEWESAPCESRGVHTLAAGSSSDSRIDIDGFRVPDGLRYQVDFTYAFGAETTWLDPGWHKISTDTVAHITTHRPGPVIGPAQ